MSSMAVQSPIFLPSHSQEAGRKAEPSPSLGARIKNVLLGRVCIDWKDYIIVAFVVINVAKAAVSFFTGHWMMAMIELLTGGFLAKMRKDYRQFTDLHAATGEYRRENTQHRNNNLMQAQEIARFKSEVGHLVKERERFGEENKTFARSNARYEELSHAMEGALGKASREIDNATNQGRAVSKKVLKNALETFKTKKELLERVEKEISDRLETQDDTLRQYRELAEQVGHMNVRGVEALNQANEELGQTKLAIAHETAKLKELGSQISRMRSEVDRLETARKEIETATGLNLDSANQVRGALSLGGLASSWFGPGKQAPAVLDALQKTSAASA
ncbi:MAG: hypothetical protein KR126chlam3_00831 [Chlamydiae bacterium]|nr:hypothetical protein [Chlamydiota bacterium]